jgi:protein O-mannosyl-transferase
MLWFWVEPFFGMYIPFTYNVWGFLSSFTLNPFIFHMANVVLHLGSTLLVYLLCKRLVTTRGEWGAFLGTLVFACHPAQAESVAWISGLKDVLFTFLLLLAVHLNLIAYEKNNRRCLFVSHIAFFLSLASKPTAVIGPLVLITLYRLALHTSWKTAWVQTRVWVLLLLPFVLVTKWIQADSHVQDLAPLWSRPWIALDTTAFYLKKTFLPVGLGLDYGRSPSMLLATGKKLYLGLWPLVVMAGLLAFYRKSSLILAGFLLFLVGFLPVSGLIAFQYQLFSTTADRYLYPSLIGVALLVSAAFSSLKIKGRALLIAWVAGVCALGVVQVGYWRTDDAVFQRALQVNPRSFLAHNNYAFYLYHREKYQAAVDHFSKAVESRPKHLELRVNYASSLAKAGRLSDSVREFQKVLEMEPRHFNANFHLGRLLFDSGRKNEGLKYLAISSALSPENEAVKNFLASARKQSLE